MYECPLERKRTEKAFVFHYLNCTCSHVKLYHYHMVDQSAHIRDYFIHKGWLSVRWDETFGMLLGYPRADKSRNWFKWMMKVRWPY